MREMPRCDLSPKGKCAIHRFHLDHALQMPLFSTFFANFGLKVTIHPCYPWHHVAGSFGDESLHSQVNHFAPTHHLAISNRYLTPPCTTSSSKASTNPSFNSTFRLRLGISTAEPASCISRVSPTWPGCSSTNCPR